MQVITPLIIIFIIALAIYLAWYNSARQKGKRGEMRVFSILSQLPRNHRDIFDSFLIITVSDTICSVYILASMEVPMIPSVQRPPSTRPLKTKNSNRNQKKEEGTSMHPLLCLCCIVSGIT